MEIKIIVSFENAKQYLLETKKDNTDANGLWKKHMIEPFWGDITMYAPFDQSFKQPPCITELGVWDIHLGG